jgi:hypothetical protein
MPGTKLSLAEIREQVKTHPDLQNLTPEREHQLLADLDEYRSRKTMGVKATEAAATADAARTLARLGTEVSPYLFFLLKLFNESTDS